MAKITLTYKKDGQADILLTGEITDGTTVEQLRRAMGRAVIDIAPVKSDKSVKVVKADDAK